MRMPDFLIIGAAKSGTTSLWRYLDEHPGLFMSPVKEPNFFAYEGQSVHFQGPMDDELINRWSVTSLGAYQALFAEARPNQLAGEASFTNLYDPRAPERIQQYIPNVKLIAVLRNPVERAFSNFTMLLCDGLESCYDFEETLARETHRIRSGWSPAWHYKQVGFYHAQLQRYFDRFDPQQIRVYLYDDLEADTAALVQDVFAFLGVAPHVYPNVSVRHNASGVPASELLHQMMHTRNLARGAARLVTSLSVRKALARRLHAWNLRQSPIPHSAARQLCALYREDILALQGLIGRDLSHWLKPS